MRQRNLIDGSECISCIERASQGHSLYRRHSFSPGAAEQTEVTRIAALTDLLAVHRPQDGAPRFMGMRAIRKPAQRHEGAKLSEQPFDPIGPRAPWFQLPHSTSIDDPSAEREAQEGSRGRRVPAF